MNMICHNEPQTLSQLEQKMPFTWRLLLIMMTAAVPFSGSLFIIVF